MFFHTVSIQRYGGAEGVRDAGALEAAVGRPWSASFGEDHYPTPFSKAAALCESIVRRHAFVDGNKRTAVASAAYLLSTFGYGLEAGQKELEDFVVGVAEGNTDIEEMARWLEDHAERQGAAP